MISCFSASNSTPVHGKKPSLAFQSSHPSHTTHIKPKLPWEAGRQPSHTLCRRRQYQQYMDHLLQPPNSFNRGDPCGDSAHSATGPSKTQTLPGKGWVTCRSSRPHSVYSTSAAFNSGNASRADLWWRCHIARKDAAIFSRILSPPVSEFHKQDTSSESHPRDIQLIKYEQPTSLTKAIHASVYM